MQSGPIGGKAVPKAQAATAAHENDTNDVDRPLDERARSGAHIGTVMAERFGRRAFLEGVMMAAPLAAAPNWLMADTAKAQTFDSDAFFEETLGFQPVAPSTADTVTVPNGYTTDVVLRWGDSINPAFDDLDTTTIIEGDLVQPGAAEAQANRFGVACDAAHFFPINGSSDNGVICVNHEFTTENMLFPIGTSDPTFFSSGGEALDAFYSRLTPEQQQEGVQVSLNAHGVTIVEIAKDDNGAWRVVRDSLFNRRLTAQTPMEFSGPLRGNRMVQAEMAPETGQIGQDGTMVLGTLNNCAGGVTPWGTYLTCEENFDQYFGFQNPGVAPIEATGDTQIARAINSVSAFGGNDGPSDRRWDVFGREVDRRFDARVEPKEIVRFGYVVEVDPFDPNDVPTKRTAMGRFKHEGANSVLTADNRLAVYSGDDARLEFAYKFVTEGQVTPATTKADNLLDSGTIFAAKFNADGTGEWLALTPGQNGLNEDSGFGSLADVASATREAATLAGATIMDRPEDIEAHNGRVYIAMTKNADDLDDATARNADNVDAANPRIFNANGHVIEIVEDGLDHGATTFTWEIFILAGDPMNSRFISNHGLMRRDSQLVGDGVVAGLEDATTYFGGSSDPAAITPLGAPDNLTTDSRDNLWIVTDGNNFGNDGAYAAPTQGQNRGRVQQFMSGPVDCEVCGAELTPDERTLFLNVQHPGNTQVENPSSTWPDGERPDADQFQDSNGNIQPRGSLIAVRHVGDGVVGS